MLSLASSVGAGHVLQHRCRRTRTRFPVRQAPPEFAGSVPEFGNDYTNQSENHAYRAEPIRDDVQG